MGPLIVQMALMALESDEPITIILDTPGGSVDFGSEFIDAMGKFKARDVKLVCVAREAASMGMAIFNACDERYAVKDGGLLWHSAWTQSQHLNREEAEKLAKELAETDKRLLDPIKANLCLTPEEFEKARKQERLWKPEELAAACPDYLKVIDKLEGDTFPEYVDPLTEILRRLTNPQPEPTP